MPGLVLLQGRMPSAERRLPLPVLASQGRVVWSKLLALHSKQLTHYVLPIAFPFCILHTPPSCPKTHVRSHHVVNHERRKHGPARPFILLTCLGTHFQGAPSPHLTSLQIAAHTQNAGLGFSLRYNPVCRTTTHHKM